MVRFVNTISFSTTTFSAEAKIYVDNQFLEADQFDGSYEYDALTGVVELRMDGDDEIMSGRVKGSAMTFIDDDLPAVFKLVR